MRFDTQTARLMAAKSAECRRANKQHRQERENLLKRLLAAEENRLLQTAEAPAQLPVNAPDDDYLAERLARVRKQIAMLDTMLEEQLSKSPLDAGAVERLASANCRVAELERTLANRPLPGSRRPAADRSKPICTFTPPEDS